MSVTSDFVASSALRGANSLEQTLHSSPYRSVRQLVCNVERDRVVVRGTVSSYYLKQVAESLASKAVGLGRLECDIQVQGG